MAKIKTFEAGCKLLKIKSTDLPVVKHLLKIHQQALIAHYKLIIIAQVLNDGWQPNWSDNNEIKYFPYFGVKADPKHPAGVGFSGTDCDVWFSSSGVGSRLCFKSSELALYAGKQFAKLYQEYHLMS